MVNQDISNSSENIERYKERLTNFGREFELGLFFHLFRKSLIWNLLFVGLFVSLAFIYLRYAPQIYQAKSVIQIKTSNTASKVLNVQDIYDESEQQIAEAIELLRSTNFIKRVISTLPLQVSYFSEGTFRNFEQYIGTPYHVEFNQKSTSLSSFKFYIDFKDSASGAIYYFNGPNKVSVAFKTNEWCVTPIADLRVTVINYEDISHQQNSAKKNQLFFVINNPDVLANEIITQLSVKILNEAAKTVEISFNDNNPAKTADIVNTISEEFIKYDIEFKSISSKKVLSFIDTQLAIVSERLRNSETSIQVFKKDNKLSTPGNNFTEVNISRLNALDDDIVQMDLQAKVLDEIEKNISKQQSVDSYSLIAMLSGSEYEGSINKQVESLLQLIKEREEMLYDVKSNSQEVKSKDSQIEIQKRMLLESVTSLQQKIELRKKNLTEKSKELEDRFYKIPTEEVEYSRLQRLFAINEKFYTLLLEKKTEYSISEAGYVSQHVILEHAQIPSYPVSPNRKLVYISYILISVLLGFFLVLIRYVVHDQINSLNDITKFTNASIAVLGIVPRYKKEIPVSQLIIDKNPKSIIAEAFRSIRTNLQFISNTPGPKLMAITSTISGEGKTFVAINLAGILAFSGKKVIILDLDMRKPKIHRGFNAENSKGMSTILINKDQVDDCIQHSAQENLDFITAGPVPPNPSELIISKKMEEIIDYLKTKYDIVVVDNPPVGLVTDGLHMIQKADYPIYIFRAEYSKRNFIQNVDRLFNENNIQRISVILNGVDIQRKTYGYNYGYGYGYGYGSGYGYGYYDDVKKEDKQNILSRIFKRNSSNES